MRCLRIKSNSTCKTSNEGPMEHLYQYSSAEFYL